MLYAVAHDLDKQSEVARCSYRFNRKAAKEAAMLRPPVAEQPLPRDRTYGSGLRSLMFFLFVFLLLLTGWEQAIDEQVAAGLASAFIACDDPDDDGGDNSREVRGAHATDQASASPIVVTLSVLRSAMFYEVAASAKTPRLSQSPRGPPAAWCL